MENYVNVKDEVVIVCVTGKAYFVYKRDKTAKSGLKQEKIYTGSFRDILDSFSKKGKFIRIEFTELNWNKMVKQAKLESSLVPGMYFLNRFKFTLLFGIFYWIQGFMHPWKLTTDRTDPKYNKFVNNGSIYRQRFS